MASTDPETGARQTVEQRAALDAQQREGFLARIEGRFLAFQEQLSALGTTLAAQTARVDTLEQKVKRLGPVGAVELEHVPAPAAVAHAAGRRHGKGDAA